MAGDIKAGERLTALQDGVAGAQIREWLAANGWRREGSTWVAGDGKGTKITVGDQVLDNSRAALAVLSVATGRDQADLIREMGGK